MTVRVTRDQVARFRARASHLGDKLPAGSFVEAAHAGLQDSAPRAGIVALHARLDGVQPEDWEHPTLAQVWFRGGADYIIPRCDIGIFTLGASSRDPERRAAVDALADRIVDAVGGEMRKVREVSEELVLDRPMGVKLVATSGRVLIRWNASMIWLIACERPDIDEEEARLELARRFLRWFGPQTRKRFAWWAAVEPREATQTWKSLDRELVEVEFAGEVRSMLRADVDTLLDAEPLEGVRLLAFDDPFTKMDRDYVVADQARRDWVLPPVGTSPGYMPGAVLLDGEIAGVWQRQQRRVTIHPWRKLPKNDVETEALSLPIPARSTAEVRWEKVR